MFCFRLPPHRRIRLSNEKRALRNIIPCLQCHLGWHRMIFQRSRFSFECRMRRVLPSPREGAAQHNSPGKVQCNKQHPVVAHHPESPCTPACITLHTALHPAAGIHVAWDPNPDRTSPHSCASRSLHRPGTQCTPAGCHIDPRRTGARQGPPLGGEGDRSMASTGMQAVIWLAGAACRQATT